jgi:polyhydroxyalkanoate synthesis repressor PhaR
MVGLSKKTRLIKKYKNRRLYDLEISQYITVDDLRHYVIDGLAFQVVDAAGGKDITNATLLQIFVEMESNSLPFLSSAMLRQLIILANHPMHDALKSMLEQMMMAMETQLQSKPYLSDFQKATEAWDKQTRELVTHWQSLFRR